MQSSAFYRRLFTAALLLAFSAGAALADDYKVKLNRPVKVGDEYKTSVTCKVIQSRQMTMNGQQTPKQNQDFTAELKGSVKVLAINEKLGQPTHISITVDKFTSDGDDVCPAGTVISAENTGEKTDFGPKTSYTLDGKEADPKDLEVIDAVLGVSSPNSTVSDDQALGTDQPQAVGATWPVNADNCAKQLAAEGLPVSADNVKGESSIVEVKKVNDTDVMVVKSNITCDGLKKDLAGGAAITDGKLSAVTVGTLPVDASLPGVSFSEKSKITMTIALPNGAGTVEVIIDRDRKETREPIAK